nr:uroporphyrinogen-III synthase [Parenemella sanctibonifatiensis]
MTTTTAMKAGTAGKGSTTPSASPDRLVAGPPPGHVIYVGTGPGDPELLTLGAVRAIAEAAAVVLDTPEQRELFEHAAINPGGDAEVVDLSAEGRLRPSVRAKKIAKLARGGKRVVRLVAGDPFLDGGVAEEAAACVRAGLAFEVIPGVSSLTAIPEYVGISMSSPSGVHFVSALNGEFTKVGASQWGEGTLVIATRGQHLAAFVEAALSAGRDAEEEVVVTSRGGSNQQSSVVMSLAEVQTFESDADGRIHLMLGAALQNREELAWYESKPLFGWRVLVPRTKDDATQIANRLRGHGADPEEVGTISVEPPRTPQQMDRAIKGLVAGRYEWLCFTSVNAVKAVREKFDHFGLDARDLSGLKVAAVNAETAQAMRDWGIEPDLVPVREQTAHGLGEEWPPYDDVLDPINRIFVPRADLATEQLAATLVELGWEVEEVTAYRTVRAAPPPVEVREAIKSGDFDAVCFTSSSTVRNLVGIAGKPHANTLVAAIGQATAEACEEHGLTVSVVAAEPDPVVLADALATFAAERRTELEEQGEPVLKPSELKQPRRRR